jgi:hypothetical protein
MRWCCPSTKIQALDRTQPGLPLKPGKCVTPIGLIRDEIQVVLGSTLAANFDRSGGYNAGVPNTNASLPKGVGPTRTKLLI